MAATYGDFTYEIIGQSVRITGYDRQRATVEFPSEINGLPVTVIDRGMEISDNPQISDMARETRIIIPDSITTIGDYSFVI